MLMLGDVFPPLVADVVCAEVTSLDEIRDSHEKGLVSFLTGVAMGENRVSLDACRAMFSRGIGGAFRIGLGGAIVGGPLCPDVALEAIVEERDLADAVSTTASSRLTSSSEAVDKRRLAKEALEPGDPGG